MEYGDHLGGNRRACAASRDDVTLHELRLESFFPADAASRAWFEAQAA